MQIGQWILCPLCGNKTRLRIREDTEIRNFPLFCPKCKQETLINVKEMNMSVIKEPDNLLSSNSQVVGSVVFHLISTYFVENFLKLYTIHNSSISHS